MNKLLKFNLFNSLEVSIKLSHLIHVQSMYTVNLNNSNCTEKIDKKRDFTDTSVLCYNIDCNYYFYNPFHIDRTSYVYNPFNSNRTPYSYRQFHSGRTNYKKWNSAKNIMSLRRWETVNNNPGTNPGFIFTLMSYNVLAQDLLDQHTYLYKNHDSEALIWPVRWKNLFKEITKFLPDILCLQEVQESHLKNYYSLLETLGYNGFFKKRTGYQTDGCAIYYKSDNVTLLDYSFVEFFQPRVPLLNRDNVGIVMKFAPKLHPTREFVVATTHLLYNPKRDDVRMAQMQLLLTDVEKMSYKKNEISSYYLPTIVTGDLNSTPTSILCEFIKSGDISYNNLSPRLLQTNNEMLVTSALGITDNCQNEELVRMRNGGKEPKKKFEYVEEDCQQDKIKKLSHNFKFKSVYNHGTIDLREGTTHQDEWLTVDYIFYNIKFNEVNKEDKLKLLSRYRLPTTKELDGITIPNTVLGSDHLSLLAKFKLDF